MRENSIPVTDTRRLSAQIIEPTIVRGAGYAVVHWSNLDGTNRMSGEFVRMPGFRLQCVQIFGSFGGAVTIVGRNDAAGAAIVVLKDRSGKPLCVTTTGTHQIAVPTNWVAPVAATGVTDVDVLAVYEKATS